MPSHPQSAPSWPRQSRMWLMGVLGDIARTAVVAGTWTAVSNRVSRRQAGRWAAEDQSQPQPQPQPQPYMPPPPGRYQRPMFQSRPAHASQPAPMYQPSVANDMSTTLAQLQQLGDLK